MSWTRYIGKVTRQAASKTYRRFQRCTVAMLGASRESANRIGGFAQRADSKHTACAKADLVLESMVLCRVLTTAGPADT